MGFIHSLLPHSVTEYVNILVVSMTFFNLHSFVASKYSYERVTQEIRLKLARLR